MNAARLLLVLLIAVLLAGCGTDAPTATAVPTATAIEVPTSTPIPPPLSADAKQTVLAELFQATAVAAQQLGNADDCATIANKLRTAVTDDWTAYRRALLNTWVDSWKGRVVSTSRDTQNDRVDLTVSVEPACIALVDVSPDQGRYFETGDSVTISGVVHEVADASGAVILSLLPDWVQ